MMAYQPATRWTCWLICREKRYRKHSIPMGMVKSCNCAICVEKRLLDANLPAETKLLEVRRVAVAGFSGDPRAVTPAHEMLVATLCATGRWVVTEHPSRADAVFRGHIQLPVPAAGRLAADELGLSGGDSLAAVARMAVMAHVARQEQEQRQKPLAELTLRLTTQQGIVLWASSQAAAGGRGRSAAAELVERAVRQLVRVIEREEEEMAPAPESMGGLAALGRALHREEHVEEETLARRVKVASAL